MTHMQITVSVGGRFWGFNLAHQLHKHGHLERLITSYPKFAVVKYGIPTDRITSLPLKEVLSRANSRLPVWMQRCEFDFYFNDWFDRQASGYLPECDICVAWSGSGLHTIRRAKANGAITIIERGSSHIEYQRDILREEYARLGIRVEAVSPKIVEKELQEYTEADYIAVPSGFAKQTFLDQGVPENKLIHVPFGVNLEEFHPLPQGDDTFRVINVGRQGIRKGTMYLLEAFTRLNLPDAELLLVGPVEQEFKPFLRKYKGKFQHIGVVPQSQLLHYYARGSVFVIPSVEEGLAMVQAQAMACGLPVICTTNTGGGDIVRDGIDGFIVPIRDVEKLKERILYMYENREVCREMGQNALKHVSAGYSWDDYGMGVMQSYLGLLRNKYAG